MGNLSEIFEMICKLMGELIYEFYPEEIIKSQITIGIFIFGITIFIIFIIYSRIKSKDTESWVRKKRKKQKENEKTPD